MKTLRLILGDQLSRSISSLDDVDIDHDVVLMVEVRDETCYVPHHRQKIVLILSAMRHFSQQLEDEGIHVDYVQLDEKANTGCFSGELERAISRHGVEHVVVTEPGEWRVLEMIQAWSGDFGVNVEVRTDTRFLCSCDEFADWADGRKSLRMEHFYRDMRRRTGWLMNGDKPEGERWNYDADNRKSVTGKVTMPNVLGFEPDDITDEVITLVKRRFADHFGELETFGWATTHEQARQALQYFIRHCLSDFGDYQDAMKAGEDYLFHSVLSPYINIGLLQPREVCEAVLAAYHEHELPLNSVEGFIRQVLGWREYMRGIYWLHMPDYAQGNYLEATRDLPAFYWSGETDMNCLFESIDATRHNAYAHHIQRLMVTGNFALLAGIAPEQVEQWYLSVYADAFEWVELPNTHGMALHADGGLLSSKPYAASGAYINRMSDYCKACVYDPKIKQGEGACPFNYLYWHFLIDNESRLRSNPRMGMPYRNLDNMDKARREEIMQQATDFLQQLDKKQAG
ncbi:MAG: cryptochrome/photolyase family protein [Gammaproteobacteria bacterium]|nr:cryptochrome/photolyase family protein [Gammaproteobacteria bacterium]